MSVNLITASLRVSIGLIQFCAGMGSPTIIYEAIPVQSGYSALYKLFADPDKFNAKKAKNAMSNNKTLDAVAEIFARFAHYGNLEYGESVTQRQHALQTACLAEHQGAGSLLIAATLLHDFGHLLHDEDIADRGIDALHEELGAQYLGRYFVPAVVEPGRLHVQAKRYLCAVDSAYFSTLSPASVQSLALQGGPFDPAGVAAFEALPHWQAAVDLRRWDDLGKDPHMTTPPLEHYRPHITAGLKTDAS